MKKVLFLVVGTTMSLAACAQFGSAALEPKMLVTCKGVAGSIKLSASEAETFVKDIKNKNKSAAVCQTHADFCKAAFALSAKELDCSVAPAL